MPHWTILATAISLSALLLVAARGDLRTRTIPNGLNAAIALLAPVWWWANGLPLWPDVTWQIGAALIVFALFATAFALGMMGGGDVKMIAALALWFPPRAVLLLLVVMALAGGVLTLLTLIEHKAKRRPGMVEVPYGIAIALAGFATVTNHILTSSVQ